MPVAITLMRTGAKKAPHYRVVAADSRSPRDGRFLEILGTYHPRAYPAGVRIDTERVAYWVARGASVSPTVARLLGRATAAATARSPDAGAS